MGGRLTASVLSLALLLLPSVAGAQPDPRQMSGVPLPVSDIPDGTVTVRVIRGALSNAVQGQDVQLLVGGAARTVKTNEAGRAEFPGLPAGARVKAWTSVDGERIESQEFAVPSSGGVRLMLVAAPPAGAAAAGAAGPPGQAPAQPGAVLLGDQTRFVYEMGDEALTGFYILQIVNSSTAPVQPSENVSFTLPEGAEAATIMQGSSPQGTLSGTKVSVAGPFQPGPTLIQVAFTVPIRTGSLTVAQVLPVALAQVTVLVEKVGAMQVDSPQITQRRDVRAEHDTYILGQGAGLGAGSTLALTFSGLPHAPAWPRNVALALAAALLAAGLWAAARPGRAAEAEEVRRRKLDETRERLFTDLAVVEEQFRAGTLDEGRYAARRRELVRALERVYAELDAEAAA